MSRVELLTVEDCIPIKGRGVIVNPDFSVPEGWKNRTDRIMVTKPDGKQYEATAQFNMAHLLVRDPEASIDERWRVVIQVLNIKKKDLPAGSKISVSQETKDALLPNNVA